MNLQRSILLPVLMALAPLTLGGCGLLIGAFSMTGVVSSLANDLLRLAGDNALLLLVMCAITSLVLGLGLTTTACYIFLAILVAPALEKLGLNKMAVHMFIFYWGMLSSITPPVAIASFAAAGIAGASPMKTGWESMWAGSIIYFIPFFFVLAVAPFPLGACGDDGAPGGASATTSTGANVSTSTTTNVAFAISDGVVTRQVAATHGTIFEVDWAVFTVAVDTDVPGRRDAQLDVLADLLDTVARRRLAIPSLRTFLCGGAPIPPVQIERALRELGTQPGLSG